MNLTPVEVAAMLHMGLAVTEAEIQVLFPSYVRPRPSGTSEWAIYVEGVANLGAPRRRWAHRVVDGVYQEQRLVDVVRRPPRPAEDPGCMDCARDALGDCTTVLERHGHHVRRDNRTLCVFHDERNPAMAVFTGRDGRSRFFCHACGTHGDVFDLEAKLSGGDFAVVLRTWGRCRCGNLDRLGA